jgi:hypothetical protein
MKKLLLVGVAVLFAASAAYADYTLTYGWEDGVGTILGSYGSLVNDTNVTGPQVGQDCLVGPYNCPGAFEGDRYLHVAESPHDGTPQAYLACITGCLEGDQITASFYGYDITPGASPSLRIWGHYSDAVNCPDCPGSYTGSAGGDAGYTDGTGWSVVTHTWTFTSSGDDYALVVEARLYSTPSTQDPCLTDFFIDYISVTVPDHCSILFPDMTGPSAVEPTNWGGIKALYR